MKRKDKGKERRGDKSVGKKEGRKQRQLRITKREKGGEGNMKDNKMANKEQMKNMRKTETGRKRREVSKEGGDMKIERNKREIRRGKKVREQRP